jgi:NAD(P)-dependent dehydrogenase (short-subunit alcohol dehydrogenase family)
MGMRLEGRVTGITGGALGIGRATARAFAAEGALVALGDIEHDGAEAVAKEIKGQGGKAIAIRVDVGDAGQVQAFVDEAVAAFGRLDVMFANAGIAHSAPFLEHPEAQWHRVLRVNLTGVFLCCQAAARQMVPPGSAGCVQTALPSHTSSVHALPSSQTTGGLLHASKPRLVGSQMSVVQRLLSVQKTTGVLFGVFAATPWVSRGESWASPPA